MSSDAINQLATELLLSGLLTMLALGSLSACLVFLYLRQKERPNPARSSERSPTFSRDNSDFFGGSCQWLMIKCAQVQDVQAVLGLSNPVPCSWGDGLAGMHGDRLFVSPPLRGWILVVGQGLPEPSEDIDRLYHFMVRLSRSLGDVQYFHVHRAVNHHAWIWMDRGAVVRAYAWAGETLWNQGQLTRAERDLDLRCFAYTEEVNPVEAATSVALESNGDRLASLAARWSFDPSSLKEHAIPAGLGIVGELTRCR